MKYDIHVVGSCCIKQFIDVDKQKKTCERCLKAHKNRRDCFCNDCRLVIKQEEINKLLEKYAREYKEKLDLKSRERINYFDRKKLRLLAK